jgi:putative transposase
VSWLLASSASESLRFLERTRLADLARLASHRAVFRVLVARVRSRLAAVADRTNAGLQAACRPTGVVAGLIVDVTRSRSALLAENAMLRQQLIVASRAVKRPALHAHERGLLVLLARLVPRWRDALLLVKPETSLRWHREGFRVLWRCKSRRRKPAKPKMSDDVIALIRRMARENRLWGAERIRGGLLKLGITVAKRTIQRYMRAVRPPVPPRGQSWKTFLANHTVWACDFLQVYDVWFRPLFAFFVIDIKSREVVHVAATRAPTERWTAQQLRNITPFGQGPDVIIRDRDSKFGVEFDRVAKGAGIKVVRTAVRAPLMNARCERFLGSVRRECLDHIIIFGRRHLVHVLREYCFRFFNTRRPHQGIRQRIPTASETKKFTKGATVRSLPVLGGLHHDYQAAA